MHVQLTIADDNRLNMGEPGTDKAVMALGNAVNAHRIAAAIAAWMLANPQAMMLDAKSETTDDLSSASLSFDVPAEVILTALEDRPMDQANT